jgi:hypothetical protein
MTLASIDSILSMYGTWGNETYDEDVTQLAHALQCAALAKHEGSSEELIAAALLHDIGHLFEIERKNAPDYSADLRHELTGSDYLSELFPTAKRNVASAIITTASLIGGSFGLIGAGLLFDRDVSYVTVMMSLAMGPVLVAVLEFLKNPETAHRKLEELNPEDSLLQIL